VDVPYDTLPYRILHDPSGDEAEAATRNAAITAARTLLEDNQGDGQCRIFRGRWVVDMVWLHDEVLKHTDMKER